MLNYLLSLSTLGNAETGGAAGPGIEVKALIFV